MPDASQIPWSSVATVATTVGGYLLAFLLIPRIVLDRRESGATLAWILFIAIVPYLGALLFFLVGQTRVRRRSRKRQRSRAAVQRSMDQLTVGYPGCDLEQPPAEMSEAAQDISRLAAAVTDTPLIGGNAVEVFIDANQAYDSMEQAIRSAEHHVLLQSYIYRADEAGERFRDLLIEKAKAGVEVKLLVDGVGGQELSKRFIRPLLQAGGQFGVFMPVFRLRSTPWRPNLRNHRKILVVDDRIGFAGGLNIGVEYQGRRKRYAPWRDTHLRLEGPAVRRLQEVFVEDWLFATGEDLADAEHFVVAEPCGKQLVQVVDSGPDHRHETIHAVFFTAINEANRSVYITTPYFVPDAAMLLALKSAAWRGVDVRLLVPGKSDLRLVQWAGRSYHQELLEAGVQLYEHRPGVLHAKTMVIDGSWSTVGSANMDRRSFRLNFEVNVLVSGRAFAEKMEAIFEADIAGAKRITQHMLRAKPLRSRMVEAFARVLSPVL
jgi:cardiolipin synthase